VIGIFWVSVFDGKPLIHLATVLYTILRRSIRSLDLVYPIDDALLYNSYCNYMVRYSYNYTITLISYKVELH
jgi:hypothetical protein